MADVVVALTIPDGATISNFLHQTYLRNASSVTIKSPASLGTAGTTKVMVTDKKGTEAVEADFADLQSNGSDVTLTADKALVITELGARSMAIKSASDPGEDLVFQLIIAVDL